MQRSNAPRLPHCTASTELWTVGIKWARRRCDQDLTPRRGTVGPAAFACAHIRLQKQRARTRNYCSHESMELCQTHRSEPVAQHRALCACQPHRNGASGVSGGPTRKRVAARTRACARAARGSRTLRVSAGLWHMGSLGSASNCVCDSNAVDAQVSRARRPAPQPQCVWRRDASSFARRRSAERDSEPCRFHLHRHAALPQDMRAERFELPTF